MSRIAYLIEIQPSDIATIAFAAGVLTAQGVPQGQKIGEMLDSVQMVEVPDEFGIGEDDEQETDTEDAETEFEDEGGRVIEFPGTDPITDPDIALTPDNDPTAPENLGIALNLPAPPANYFPTTNQEDFGAGPPPRD